MQSFSYTIETEIPSNYRSKLLDFIYQKYILPQEKRFTNILRTQVDGYPSLSFTTLDPNGRQDLKVKIKTSEPINVEIVLLEETVSEKRISQMKEDIIISIELFEEQIRKSTIYFAWREGEEIVPERIHGKESKLTNRMFLETQILFFMVFIALSMVLFVILNWLTPIVLMAIQFVFVFYSNRIIAKSGDWRITEKNSKIHLLEYHTPLEDHNEFKRLYSGNKLVELKREVYEQTIAEERKD